jgi:Zn-dependent peptidase ImmA (M78 family)/DNA-binding XRE family transcriptional regulator
MTTFNNEMLILAREFRGFSQKELAEKLGIGQGTLSKMENGIFDIKDDIENISSVLNFPIDFFYSQNQRFEISTHYYRKKVSVPQKIFTQYKATLNILRQNIEKFLESVEIEINLPTWDVDKNGSPSHYANFLREVWKLPQGRLENLVDIIENNGIIVFYVDFGEETKLDGLSIYTKNNQPVIFLNKSYSFDRLRFTLAHELGHLGMHFGKKISSERDVEKEAMEFASEFLVPISEIRPYLSNLNIEKLGDLKRYWQVSMSSLLEKSRKSNSINDNQYKYLRIQLLKMYGKREPFIVPEEKPTLIKEIIDTFMEELDYSLSDLSKMLMLSIKDVEKFYFDPKKRFQIIKKNN